MHAYLIKIIPIQQPRQKLAPIVFPMSTGSWERLDFIEDRRKAMRCCQFNYFNAKQPHSLHFEKLY